MSCWMEPSELPQSTPAIFNARMRDELKLDSLPNGLPAQARGRHRRWPLQPPPCRGTAAARARAQIARDIIMARMIRPYVDRGVVLLTGNGHVMR